MKNTKLELYYFDSCPYCQLVMSAIKRLNVKVDYKNIHQDSASLTKLTKDTGRKTVPCLYINGKPMHESGEIVEWLEENEASLEKR